MAETFKYPGKELELFQFAQNWKKYFSTKLKPYIKGNVLEPGAGIGASTLLLNNKEADNWVLLEPDEEMFKILNNKKKTGELPENSSIQKGTINTLAGKFDTIIYIDVLEHIEKDEEEISKASALLNRGGYLIVLSPAFQLLYSPFDKAIGHYRRYSKKSFYSITPNSLSIVNCQYIDTAGFFAGLMNKIFLRQKYPSQKQVIFWDKWLIPISKITDKILFHQFGKSIVCVWQKNED